MRVSQKVPAFSSNHELIGAAAKSNFNAVKKYAPEHTMVNGSIVQCEDHLDGLMTKFFAKYNIKSENSKENLTQPKPSTPNSNAMTSLDQVTIIRKRR